MANITGCQRHRQMPIGNGMGVKATSKVQKATSGYLNQQFLLPPWNCFHNYWPVHLFWSRTQMLVLWPIDKKQNQHKQWAEQRWRFCLLILDSSYSLVLPPRRGEDTAVQRRKGMVPSAGSHPVERQHAHHICLSPPACRLLWTAPGCDKDPDRRGLSRACLLCPGSASDHSAVHTGLGKELEQNRIKFSSCTANTKAQGFNIHLNTDLVDVKSWEAAEQRGAPVLTPGLQSAQSSLGSQKPKL